MTTVAELIDELEDIAPPELADADDRIGLQVGDPSAEVRRLCVAVDVSVPVVDLAVERGADLLVAHHPLIYAPLTSIAEVDPVGKRLAKLVRAKAALYVMHTNYDTVPGGINDALASKLGVVGCEPLTTRKTDPLVKIVVFVPESAVEQVRNAMADAGADVLVPHCGLTTKGSIGAHTALTLGDAAKKVQAMHDAAKAVNPDVLVLCHGGPIAEPADAQFIFEHTSGIVGFFGASSIERLPTEVGIQGQTQRFKELRIGGDA